MGEGVPLLITLRARGPFSGTASFDLPETAQTFFIKEGSPSVGSETVGGDTWLTQAHEFRVYTQLSGTVEIPPIRIRFEAKKDYISDPEPHTGSTEALHFQSRRPPGTKGIVVSVEDMKVQQTWTGGAEEDLKPGDVVIRRITRKANKTTGMIFPDVDLSAPDGIQVYAARPEIHDKSYRGETTAERIDVIKYQFSRGGTFSLPELIFTWWDPVDEKLKTVTREGSAFEVQQTPSAPTRNWKWLWGLLPMALIYPIVSKVWNDLKRPERLARQAVIAACRANDPKAAYSAVLAWQSSPFSPEFSKGWNRLSETLYKDTASNWDGRAFEKAFVTEYRQARPKEKRTAEPLTPLNPGR
ncbi:hypothetical protein P4B35_18950 [Pontiellaceae bacterium B12227]|nr:hypothetical protein [Pontiellaceae bacterium B12227]